MILAIGDLHVGSLVAPWPEEAPLPDGGGWRPGRAQKWLNRCWAEMLAEAKDRKPEIVVINGDAIDGDKHVNIGVVTPRADYQASAAVIMLEPLREICQRMYFVRGTPWHVGHYAKDVTAVARQLNATEHPQTHEPTWPDLFLEHEGQVIHFAHHIGGSINPMYEATAPLRELLTLRLELLRAYGGKGPNVRGIVRSHRHRSTYIKTEDGCWALALAPWQLKTDHAYKLAPSALPQVGFAWIGAEVETRRFATPRLHVERV